jgi:hypothetical protein
VVEVKGSYFYKPTETLCYNIVIKAPNTTLLFSSTSNPSDIPKGGVFEVAQLLTYPFAEIEAKNFGDEINKETIPHTVILKVRKYLYNIGLRLL